MEKPKKTEIKQKLGLHPTLDDYIAGYQPGKWWPNIYVREPGFKHFYVRMGKRWIEGAWRDPTLDLANFEARHPGQGLFTRLIERLRREHPELTLYVESVLNERFKSKLLALGFRQINPEMVRDCYFFPANSITAPPEPPQVHVSSE